MDGPGDLRAASGELELATRLANSNNNNNNIGTTKQTQNGCNSNSVAITTATTSPTKPDQIVRPSVKRYFILILYGVCSMEKSFQWINLSTVTNKVSLYYGVDNIAVNWTSVLFMLTFIPLVLPTGWLIERIGLRKAVLIGSSGITLGAIVKCFACAEDRFYVVILGQIIVSLSEQFIFCIPARIASVWFPDHQVSLATGFGIFGNQCGIALGFIIPQAILNDLETRDEIGVGLYWLFLSTAVVSLATLVVLLFVFDDQPKYAPGLARLNKLNEERRLLEQRAAEGAGGNQQVHFSFRQEFQMFWQTLKKIMSNVNCDLLILAYGINVGTGYAIQTLLNQLIIGANNENWADADEVVGNSGLLVIFCGMCGALFWGHLCDLTHRYILINRLLYLGAILALVLFGFTLKLHAGSYHELALYGSSALMGFILIGYTVAGLDTIVELTYPIPELVSTSAMNLSPQIFGTGITFLCSAIVDTHGSNLAVGFLVLCLSVGLLVTLMIREHLNRQTAVQKSKISEQNNNKPELELPRCEMNNNNNNNSCTKTTII